MFAGMKLELEFVGLISWRGFGGAGKKWKQANQTNSSFSTRRRQRQLSLKKINWLRQPRSHLISFLPFSSISGWCRSQKSNRSLLFSFRLSFILSVWLITRKERWLLQNLGIDFESITALNLKKQKFDEGVWMIAAIRRINYFASLNSISIPPSCRIKQPNFISLQQSDWSWFDLIFGCGNKKKADWNWEFNWSGLAAVFGLIYSFLKPASFLFIQTSFQSFSWEMNERSWLNAGERIKSKSRKQCCQFHSFSFILLILSLAGCTAFFQTLIQICLMPKTDFRSSHSFFSSTVFIWLIR